MLREEDKEKEDKGGLQVINNRYMIMDRRVGEVVVKCSYDGCELEGECVNVCKGCYRMKYHNRECQLRGWDNHKSDCLEKII